MKLVRSMMIGLALAAVGQTTAAQAAQTPSFPPPGVIADPSPWTRTCANGYVRLLLGSGNESYTRGYPWIYARIDQTGFADGDVHPVVDVTIYYVGDKTSELKWELVMGMLQSAQLSRAPVILWSSDKGTNYACTDQYPRNSMVQVCTFEVDCNGISVSALPPGGRDPESEER